jgi:N utilization substance protein B
MFTKRRQARVCSLQMLYAADSCKMSRDDIFEFFTPRLPHGENYKSFTLMIFEGVLKRRDQIDALIMQHAKNWEISRMAVVDRNIIRIAVFEFIEMPQTPINVIIDEAVEISKKYSTKDSSKFINGVLDKLKTARENK